jgi:thioredoxin 1
MSSAIAISDSQFETEVLAVTQPVLVYFWASWCGPCRLMTPIINATVQTYGDRLKVVKMEVDPNPVTVSQYKVEGVPALRLFKNGQVVGSVEGIDSKQKVTDLLVNNL